MEAIIYERAKKTFAMAVETAAMLIALDLMILFASLAEKYHAEALCAEASNLDFSNCDSWRYLLVEILTFFEQNPD